ncbi:MAG: hypothetical protein ACK4TL_20215 [Hyphomicrobiaceae bacterium]
MTHDVSTPADRTCPAAVAYDLMRDILLDDPRRPAPSSDEFRAYLLDLYAECLLAVHGKRVSAHGKPSEMRVPPPPREREKREAGAAPKLMKAN